MTNFKLKLQIKKDKITFLIVFLLLLNIVSYFILPFKLDLTKNKAHTLSSVSQKIAKELDDVVNIQVFASTNLPPDFALIRQQLKDLLDEYRWQSGGKIRVSFIAPDKDKQKEESAQRLGIPQLQFSSIEQDKFQVTQGYLGIAFLFEDRKEVIPVIETSSNLEYQLTSSLLKVTNKEQPVIGLTTGHGEIWEESDSFNSNQSLIEEVLGKEFLVESLFLDEEKTTPIPNNFSALIVAGPKQEFKKEAKFALDQFLMKNKTIFFFLDGVQVDNSLQAIKAEHNLSSLLEKYGLKLKSNLVVDQSAAIANFSTGLSRFLVPYPYWIEVRPEGFNQEHPITFGLQEMVLPWTSSLEFDEQNERISPLIFSSKKSWIEEENFDLDPTQDWQPGEQTSYPLAVLLSGKLESAFEEKDVPENWEENFIKQVEKANILLIGDSEAINEKIAGPSSPNWNFLLNSLEFLSSTENLAQIKLKKQEAKPLREIPASQKEMIKYGNIIGLPLLVGLLGGGYLYWREKQRFIL